MPSDSPSSGMSGARVRVIGREGCHLCADAEVVVARVCAETNTDFEVCSIDNDPELADLYWEKIPVILVDGAVFDFWRVNEERLRGKLSSS